MMAQHTKGIAISLIVIGIVLFVLFIDIGLLPNGCSPHNALLVGGRPASRGAWGLWACGPVKERRALFWASLSHYACSLYRLF
jgi:hypothetical protein